MSTAVATWLFEWQSLVGAVIGGAMALVVALVVARSARWREVVGAAAHVSLEFGKYAATLASLRGFISPGQIVTGPLFVPAMDMVRLRPRLSPLLEASMARILPVDRSLAVQLGAVSMFADFAEREFSEAYRLFKEGAAPAEVHERLDAALEHAEEAFHSMSRSVTRIDVLSTSLMPGARLMWYRLLRLARRDKLEEDERLRALWDKALAGKPINGE